MTVHPIIPSCHVQGEYQLPVLIPVRHSPVSNFLPDNTSCRFCRQLAGFQVQDTQGTLAVGTSVLPTTWPSGLLLLELLDRLGQQPSPFTPAAPLLMNQPKVGPLGLVHKEPCVGLVGGSPLWSLILKLHLQHCFGGGQRAGLSSLRDLIISALVPLSFCTCSMSGSVLATGVQLLFSRHLQSRVWDGGRHMSVTGVSDAPQAWCEKCCLMVGLSQVHCSNQRLRCGSSVYSG